jgi:hypothetical protein
VTAPGHCCPDKSGHSSATSVGSGRSGCWYSFHDIE